ncbi:TOG array regulator of axonemal microtubules protein 2-like [Apus apus]|uniref:TOG array regulator of axonemal microtubules protein 2-like n=1 Tax=Apus apus TaxID=8895 RepID=UPI0021F8F066|nr:TOG array regulator of axonemal microtubules protein 2-like [Apus apus]
MEGVNQSLAISLDSLERGEKTECGDAWEARPFSQPQQVLLITLRLLSSNNWEQQMKGLFDIRHLAICHSEILLSRLHDVSVAITKEVKKHHSKVSGCVVVTLGELFKTLRKQMDHEVDRIASVLIPKLGDSSKLIREAADQSLGVMVVNVTTAHAKTALMATGVGHCNALVWKCAAKPLLTVMGHMGAEKLLSDTCGRTRLLLCALKVPHTSVGTVEDTGQLLGLKGLLTAQEFQSRMKGLALLLDHCKSNPQLISSNIFQIFGVLVLTLQDSHKRVSQQALEVFAVIIPIVRGALKPVMPHLMTAVLSNLNSKDSGIYAMAVKVLEAI